jgi:hypothetical protein
MVAKPFLSLENGDSPRHLFGGNTFAQASIYAVQRYILYTFQSGIWMALDGLYSRAARTALNGAKSDTSRRTPAAASIASSQIESENHDRFTASAVCHELLHPITLRAMEADEAL